MSNKEDPHRERFRNRKVEQILAQEMSLAREELRRAILLFSDSIAQPPPAQPPDSSLLISESRQRYSQAQQAFNVAQERWFQFLTKGIVPPELMGSGDE